MSTIKVDTYLTRGGASEIAIDKLKGASSAGSMLVVGEGGTVTPNLQQGLAKTWIQFNGTGTIATQDSFGVGSLTDNNTGNYSIGFTNNMANNDYASAGIGNTAGMASEAVTTSALNALCFNSSGSNNDVTIISAMIQGDLA